MGFIFDGVYHKGQPNLARLRAKQQSTYKQHDQNRQRKDHARELVQPYDRNGKPNQAFIDAYPAEAREYGFLPKDEDLRDGKS